MTQLCKLFYQLGTINSILFYSTSFELINSTCYEHQPFNSSSFPASSCSSVCQHPIICDLRVGPPSTGQKRIFKRSPCKWSLNTNKFLRRPAPFNRFFIQIPERCSSSCRASVACPEGIKGHANQTNCRLILA